MMVAPPSLLVFDWDGTLMDSTAHITRSIQRACADLGLPVPERERASHVIGLGLRDAMRVACPGLAESDYGGMVEAYKRNYLAGEETVELFPGVREALQAYRQAGYFLAVATGKGRPGLDRALEASGLAGLFDATRTVNECASKPDPEMLDQLTDYFGVERSASLMVGDTTHDLLMAKNARVPGCGLAQGAHPRQQLEAVAPLAVFDDFAGFDTWLTSLPR